MKSEPRFEDLSAYVDRELTGRARQDLEAHLATCETCRRRLDALTQTVSAVRALPEQMPPRTFTVPDQRSQSARPGWWGALVWAGGAAAAVALVIGVGLAYRTSSPPIKGAGSASAPIQRVSPNERGAALSPTINVATASDPTNPNRRLVLSADSASYSSAGVMPPRECWSPG